MNFTDIKNNRNTKIFLYFLGFIVSGVITGRALTDLSQDSFTDLLMIGITILIESSKGITFFETFNQKQTIIIRFISLIIWACIVSISLFSSMALTIGESNKKDNLTVTNSVQYKTLQENYKTEKDYFELTSDEVINLEKINIKETIKNDEKIKEYTNSMNLAKKANIITNPTQGANHYSQLIAQRAQEIRNKYNTQLQKAKDKRDKQKSVLSKSNETLANTDVKKEIKSENGITSVSAMIGTFFKKTVEQIQLRFYFFLSLIVEILICLLFFYSEIDNIKDITTRVIKKDQIKKVDLTKKVVFNIKQQHKQLKDYMMLLLENTKDGKVIGYKKASEIMGIGESKGRQLYSTLKELNILSTKNRKTEFSKNKNEALKIISEL